jgi:hypothetical protein
MPRVGLRDAKLDGHRPEDRDYDWANARGCGAAKEWNVSRPGGGGAWCTCCQIANDSLETTNWQEHGGPGWLTVRAGFEHAGPLPGRRGAPSRSAILRPEACTGGWWLGRVGRGLQTRCYSGIALPAVACTSPARQLPSLAGQALSSPRLPASVDRLESALADAALPACANQIALVPAATTHREGSTSDSPAQWYALPYCHALLC